MLDLLLLPPILKGFFALLLSGLAIPLCGVSVVRLNLLPLRYTLMHSAILAGTLALALGLSEMPMYAIVGMITVGIVMVVARSKGSDMGVSSVFMMILSLAVAALVQEVFDVPSKDTLAILWGSPFALSWSEVISFAGLSLIIIIALILFFRQLSLLFFDKETSLVLYSGMRIFEFCTLMLIALSLSLAMRFVGALLLDSLLILPVMIGLKRAVGTKELFITSSIIGIIVSVVGFFASLYFDVAPSVTVSIVSVLLYIVVPKR